MTVQLKPNQTFASIVPTADKAKVTLLVHKAVCGMKTVGSCRDATKFLLASNFSFGGGKGGLVVQGTGKDFCSPAGNCVFLLLVKHGAEYAVDIHATAYSFEITVDNSRHRSQTILESHAAGSQPQLEEYVLCGDRFEHVAGYQVELKPSPNPADPKPWLEPVQVKKYPAACTVAK